MDCLSFDQVAQRHFDVHIRSKQDWKNFQVEVETQNRKLNLKKKLRASVDSFFSLSIFIGIRTLDIL